MEHEEVHELTAGYALDALSDAEEVGYEAHLRHCERCREEFASFQETAMALAYAAPSASPPAALRERILERARGERAKGERARVVPLRPRRLGRFAAVAAAAAMIALSVWAITLTRSLSRERSARDRLETTVQLIAEPGAKQFAVEGGDGVIVVSPSGETALVLSGLAPAPSGRIYEAWVMSGDSAQAAGLFDAKGDTTVFVLRRSLPAGATVGVTLEQAGGADQPSGEPLFSAPTA